MAVAVFHNLWNCNTYWSIYFLPFVSYLFFNIFLNEFRIRATSHLFSTFNKLENYSPTHVQYLANCIICWYSYLSLLRNHLSNIFDVRLRSLSNTKVYMIEKVQRRQKCWTECEKFWISGLKYSSDIKTQGAIICFMMSGTTPMLYCVCRLC